MKAGEYMVFEYQEVKTCTAQIDIDDIGNCVLLKRDVIGQECYLIIITQLGETQTIFYGPTFPGSNQLSANVSYYYSRFDFNESKVIKSIQKFMTDAEYVELTDIDMVYNNIKSMIDFMNSYDDVNDEQLEDEGDI